MRASVLKWLAVTACGVGVVLGCSSVVEHVAEETSTGGGAGGGFGRVDSGFSDAPLSPGGTGGVIVDEVEGGVEAVAEETRSFFTAFQLDPEAEDSAGPKFIVSGDIDQDGLLDLVTGWNQSQPVQLHLQRRDAEGNISFRTVTLAGTTPIAVIAGVELGQINGDGWLDVVVLSKATGYIGLCPPANPGDPPGEISGLEGEIIVLLNPGDVQQIADGDSWHEIILVNPFVADRWVHNQFPGNENVDFETIKTQPENGGFTALAVGDVDQDGDDDIFVALNPGECEGLGQLPPVNSIDLWLNPGGVLAEDTVNWGRTPDTNLSRGVPVSLIAGSGPFFTDITLSDVDGDTDLDVVAAHSDAVSRNVFWLGNPLYDAQDPGSPADPDAVVAGFTPGIDVCNGGVADGGPCPNGDGDCLGIPDGACIGGVCIGGDSDGEDCENSDDCRGIPDGTCTPNTWRFSATGWNDRPVGQVDTNANVLTVGDIDNDGFDDVLVRSTPGQVVQWFRRPNDLRVVEPEFPPSLPIADREPVPDSDGRTDFPWPVFTLTEFNGQEPEAIAIGDVTGDGQVEVMVAAEGAVFWYDGTASDTVFDPWSPNTIIQDGTPDGAGAAVSTAAPGAGVGVTQVDTSTNINTLLVVDLDGDGKRDIVGTLDRRSGAGLSDDRIVWYRNTRTDDEP